MICLDCSSFPRVRSRRLTNDLEVVDLARRLGFESVAQDFGWKVNSVAKIVNAFDVMVGVHGAALTNMVFLSENAGKLILLIYQLYICITLIY